MTYTVFSSEHMEELFRNANAGDARSMKTLWTYYTLRNEGDKAFAWIKKAVEADNKDAGSISSLANHYASGNGVARDTRKANQLYEQVAKMGEPQAMYNIGVTCYQNGEIKQAFQYFEQAANKNYSLAKYNLALMHGNHYFDLCKAGVLTHSSVSKKNSLKEAERLLREVIDDPDDPDDPADKMDLINMAIERLKDIGVSYKGKNVSTPVAISETSTPEPIMKTSKQWWIIFVVLTVLGFIIPYVGYLAFVAFVIVIIFTIRNRM